jgi:hypothetical protein
MIAAPNMTVSVPLGRKTNPERKFKLRYSEEKHKPSVPISASSPSILEPHCVLKGEVVPIELAKADKPMVPPERKG